MLRLYSNITIGQYTFDYVMNCSILSSYDQFTDTARITIPSKFRDINRNMVNNNGVFKKGDPVTIKLGYFPNLQTVFVGFVSGIVPDSPMTIECQDVSWKLKQKNIPNFFDKNCTFNSLLTHLTTGTDIPFQVVDANIGVFKINNKDYVNVIDCLDELKKNFGVYSWCRDGSLFVGYPNTQQFYETNTLNFKFQENIISSSLEYQIKDQTDVILQGISIKLDNTKITRYCFYDSTGSTIVSDNPGTGEQRTFNYIELTQAQLDDKLRAQLPNMIYDGYKGSFLTFGEPMVRPLDKVNFTDLKFPERDGLYLIKKVETSFGTEGFRQNIEIDAKLA